MNCILWICTLSVLVALIQRQSINVSAAALCDPPCLLVSNTTNILAVDYKTSAVNSVVSGLTRAVAIDVHFSLGYIFWSDVKEQRIKRFRIDIASTTTIITGIGVCDGLAVDWRASQLYWTDTTNDTISVSDLDGNNQTLLINSYLDKPRAIALDLDSRSMFWTDWGANAKIERASMSGGQRVAIVTTYLFYPNGIVLDMGNKRVFWVDAGNDRVETVDYYGNDRKLLHHVRGLHPFGLTLIPPFLFFTDWHTPEDIHQLDATTGRVIRKSSVNGGLPVGIVAYDSSRQPSASNHCAVNNGGCSRFCVAKSSGYECVCPTGFPRKQDNMTCEDKVKNFILFTDADDKSTRFISLDVNSFDPQTLFNHLGNQRPIALDFDPVEERVYWSDIAQGRIISAFLNGTGAKVLFRCNVQTPDGLAIDHVGRNVYWTDTGTNMIVVARLDGTRRKLLIKDGLDEPRAIALDEKNGMMYWTDWGVHPKIEQAEMDGSSRQTIVTVNLAWPNGLTIDQATNRLFWVDAKLDIIDSLDLNRGIREPIASSTTNIHPFGLVAYQNVLYWTDWNTKSIERLNLSSMNHETLVTGLKRPMDIHAFGPSLIYSGSHACANGLCSDLCLLKALGYQCACPTGIQLKPDGKSCDYDLFNKTSSKKFMIFAEADTGEIYKVPLEVSGTPCFPLGIHTNISAPVAVDYDPVKERIYWTDLTLKLVARAFPNGSSVEVIVYNLTTPAGLAVDYVGRNLYWTDEGTSKIEMARLDGSSRRLIASSIKQPRAILLDVVGRKIYWGCWGSSATIVQANMDGSARTILVDKGLMWVNSLAMDYQNRMLYWCDAYFKKIERIELQGNNRTLVKDLSLDSFHPFGLALDIDVLYWSDLRSKSVHKHNMTSSVTEVLIAGMGRPMELQIYNDVKRCPQLFAPANGSLELCSNLPGQTCLFSCEKGFNVTGSIIRKCSSNGTWNGTQTYCNAVTCLSLDAPSNGSRRGCSGTTIEYYNTVCLFSCYFGFNESGSPSRKCLENGTWSGKDFMCTDTTPPSFNDTCPSNMVFYATECSSSAFITWSDPNATDNTGHVSISYPAIRPPVNLSIGLYNVLYSATDSSGNQANCTFIVQVARKSCLGLQPPINGSITSLSCGTSFGSQASIGCDTGYRMAGSRLRSCRADGTWSGNATSCNKLKEMEEAFNYTGQKAHNTRKQSLEFFPAIAVGFLVFITPIVATAVFLHKRYLRRKQNALGQLPRNPANENTVPRSPSYVADTLIGIEEMETSRSSSRSPGLKIENEADQDTPDCSNQTLHSHPPTSLPEYITKLEATFSSNGGELCSPLDSDVRVIVPKGAIPPGINQPVFFGVFSDETALLRDIPEAPNKTLISPVIECGSHDIHFSKPVEIIVPHCLCLNEAEIEWITVYRCGKFPAEVEGRLIWERVPTESGKNSQSNCWFTVKKDFIRIRTKTFSLWSIFACGGARRKRATVFSSRPDPKSDLIYLRFYVYSDNEDSKRRVELKDRERFPESKPAKEKPFRMYNDNTVITVKLANLEDGWELDKTNDTQVYNYERANGSGFRSKDSCDFAVKPEDGRDVNGFSCIVKFKQEDGDDNHEYSIYVNPGFTPLRRQSVRQRTVQGARSETTSSSPCANAGSSTSRSPEKGEEDEDRGGQSLEGKTFPDSSRAEGSADCGYSDEMVTERLCFCISAYVGGKWKRVLRNLSMDEVTIRNLEEDYKNYKVDEKCYEALLAWKESLGPQRATIKNLCVALRLEGCSEAVKCVAERKYVA